MKNMRNFNQPPERKSFSWIATLLVFGLLCIGIGFVISANFNAIPETRADNIATAASSPQRIQDEGTNILRQTQESFRSIVSIAKPAVVTIETKKEAMSSPFNIRPHIGPDDNFYFFDPYKRDDKNKSNDEKDYAITGGSGFFVSPDGYILTNNHVVDKAVEITVITEDQNSYDAELVGTDPMTDVALLKIANTHSFPYLELGNSENAYIGDWVIAIGSPIRLAQTVTVGVVSGKNREDVHVGGIDYSNFIQTDAAINFGNSGGPLLDINGKVIGINSAIAGGANITGIGFAIPSNLAKFAYENLKSHGEVVRAWIGVTIQPVDSDMALHFGLDKPMGALVNTIVDGDPAEQAGLRIGDLILEIDNEEVTSPAMLSRIIAEKEVGKPIEFKVLRNKKRMTFKVTPSRRPADVSAKLENKPVEKESPIGLSITELTERVRKELKVPENIDGVMITKVKKNSIAADKMLFIYDIISEVDNVKIKSISDYENALKNADNVALIKIFRQNVAGSGWTSLYIAVPLD
ncbi:trypsin-like peptidase domain-containing protein [bacterium]|nr:trypsin-like peptidase domain-containing protein [bacterium]